MASIPIGEHGRSAPAAPSVQTSPKNSYAQRYINIGFLLPPKPGDDAGTGKSLDLPKGLRVRVEIEIGGGDFLSHATVQIFGLKNDYMNKLSTLGQDSLHQRNNRILVYAGDSYSPVSLIFQGTLDRAWHEFGSAPETSFTCTAQIGTLEALSKVTPTSYKGRVDAATVLKAIAAKGGWTFRNNGVTAILDNPYYPGSLEDQLKACCHEAHAVKLYDNSSHTLTVWPEGGHRDGMVPLISSTTGMVGYPSSGAPGNVRVTTLFNPNIGFGSQVQIDSKYIAPAKGLWTVTYLAQVLESETPNGRWFTVLEANNPQAERPIR